MPPTPEDLRVCNGGPACSFTAPLADVVEWLKSSLREKVYARLHEKIMEELSTGKSCAFMAENGCHIRVAPVNEGRAKVLVYKWRMLLIAD